MATAPALIILLGLFPTLFLPVLQLMLLVMLAELLWRARRITQSDLYGIFNWSNAAVWQFLFFFLINAYVFDLLPGSWTHVRSVALESWSGTLASSFVLMLWLQIQGASKIKQAIQRWLPLGLMGSFAIATYFYIFSYPGERIQMFTPNALNPPLWFLIFTLISFCWFEQMNRTQKWIRLALFAMAGIMAVYAAARFLMCAWMLSALLLAVYTITLAPLHQRLPRMGALTVTALAIVSGVLVIDYFAGGLMMERFANLLEVRSDPARWPKELPRLVIWPAAISVVQENWALGIGQVNERIAIKTLLEWDHWFRAHQTYLSYLIAGGVPALISGLLYQAPILRLIQRSHIRAMFPAFIGLGIVLTLNAATDSIFQSVVGVQAYMVASLFTLRAAHG
jgi:hypothetical protein